jgi:putative transposase
MPDHFHLLLTPAPTVTLERALQLIKGGSSHKIRQQLAYKLPTWQTGFDDHRIRSAADYSKRRSYIGHNPVLQKLAVQPEEYPYSSLHKHFRGIVDAWNPELASAAKAWAH